MGNNRMRKILYISGTRADYGLMATTLMAIENHPGLNIEIAATGMHLSETFGMTVNEIKRDGFKVHEVDAGVETDDKESMALFMGRFILLLTPLVRDIGPDFILLLGDRGEMLAGAIVGAYLSIPVAHIHGGDVSSTVDEAVRHAITKLSNLHFPATEQSAERIIRMGENPEYVFMVGAPGLDEISDVNMTPPEIIMDRFGLDPSEPFILVIQHPVTAEAEMAGDQIRETLEAVKELGIQTIIVYPNSDAGGRKMIDVISEFEKLPFMKAYDSITRADYLGLMSRANAIVGNSSSGIIEAPSFKLPAVNIGTRQDGRERGANIIESGYSREEIKKAIEMAIHNRLFSEGMKEAESPYGSGNTGARIADVLGKVKIDSNLLVKKNMY